MKKQFIRYQSIFGLPMWQLVVKNPSSNAGEIRDAGSISGLGRSRGGEHGNPLQYSCLENLMNRRAWQDTVHGSQRVGHN